jgi:hypothetical protein
VKLTITQSGTGNNGTPFVLADDTTPQSMIINQLSNPNGVGGIVTDDSGFLPDLSLATQKDELIESLFLQELPRGNAQTTWTVTVNRQATTTDVMYAFIADHPAAVPTSGLVALIIANTTRYLKNAVLGSVRCVKQKGTDISFQYVLRGSYVPPIYGAAGTGTGGPWTPS